MDFPGSPGTFLGFVLRMSQFFLLLGQLSQWLQLLESLTSLLFCYLIASMCIQVIWSFMLALQDAYVLVGKKVLNNPVLVSFFFVTYTKISEVII
ncbi:hypothetical protein Lalb_Chr06g0169401 [Lupinus albus]|uniref:CASP-like protein n=1 Tax=Lupinus albus TaxID=3870 RepID=A0A6A4QEQ6_LUPAL|nr:hypothetical protein Lalb_Chr06g0169401 [Lupinus albus]